MDGKATTLHAAEPRHLSLGKLMNGYLELAEHLIVCELSYNIFCQEFILQSVVNQILGCNAFVEQTAHFVDHSIFQTGLQSAGNLFTAQLSVDIDTDDERIHRWQLSTGHWVLEIIRLNLDGTDGTLTRIHICFVMHVRARSGLQLLQHLCKLR